MRSLCFSSRTRTSLSSKLSLRSKIDQHRLLAYDHKLSAPPPAPPLRSTASVISHRHLFLFRKPKPPLPRRAPSLPSHQIPTRHLPIPPSSSLHNPLRLSTHQPTHNTANPPPKTHNWFGSSTLSTFLNPTSIHAVPGYQIALSPASIYRLPIQTDRLRLCLCSGSEEGERKSR